MQDEVYTIVIPDESGMLNFGKQLAIACPDALMIFLYGDLGAGKTTLARGFIRGLGHEGIVKSPTYTIVEPYELENRAIYHFDFYRVRDTRELEFIGIQDYFTPHAVCLIEWPEYGTGLLPPADLSCYIEPCTVGRAVKLVAHSARGNDVLKRLQNEN